MTGLGTTRRYLVDVRPDLAAQLHPTLNGDTDLGLVSPGSSKNIWWLGECGHEWPDSPGHLVSGRGCSVCSGKRVIAGLNDLASARPDLAAEWHPTRNGELMPDAVSKASGRRAWWIDSLGHEWDATINNRAFGSNCPYCAGQKVLPGFNDLATKRPDLAAQWHTSKNDTAATAVASQSGAKAWWQCAEGHEWNASIRNRTNGNGCPICKVTRGPEFAAAKRARRSAGVPVKHREKAPGQISQGLVPGYNDMQTTRPDLAAEFHPTKNAPLIPSSVPAGTGVRLWWKCDQEHEWQQTGNSRTSGGLACPTCSAAAAIASGAKRAGSGRGLFVGINDLASRRPDIAAQWHPSKNGGKLPQDVTSSTGVKAWWLGECGHEWEAVVASRTGSGLGCPVCAGQRTLTGFNDLATLQPEVAASWHPTRNGDAVPTGIAQYSNRMMWWTCPEGHEWKSTVSNRSHGQGCPFCADRGFQPSKAGYVYFLENRVLRSFKVGITNVGTTRLDLFQLDGWEILHLELFPHGSHAMLVEAAIKSWWRRDLGLPFWLGPADMRRTGGWTETISNEELPALECIERIRIETAQAQRSGLDL